MTVTISETDRRRLPRERFDNPHPRVPWKMEVVYLTGLGPSRSQVAQNVGVTEGMVRSSLRAYPAGGVDALCRFNPHPHPQSAALSVHTTTLREKFDAPPAHTVQEAVERIVTLTGIRRSPTQVRVRLKPPGFSRLKTGQIPAKADPEGPTTLPRERIGTGPERSAGWQTARVFCRCRAFRFWGLAGLSATEP